MSAESSPTPGQAELLLDIAEAAIRACFDGTDGPSSDVDHLPEPLRRPGGAFVTLHVDGQLNGCIGDIVGREAIGAGVARLAVQAAFEDPRLPQLRRRDLDRLQIEISLLSPPVEVPARTRAELLAQLTPGVDGLIIGSGHHRAVFLPAVWRQLPDPDEFLDHLLHKAGLPTVGWPNDMRAELFTTESFGRRLG